MPSPFLEGFFLQASLILAFGAQNIFVLESGLRRNRHLTVALVCTACDFVLTFLGVLGTSTLFQRFASLRVGLGIVGVAFLAYYGFMKLREAFHGSEAGAHSSQASRTVAEAVWTSLGFSLLNPHVYLDTLVLIGGYSAKFVVLGDRIAFGFGACAISFLWFFGLAFCAGLFSRLFESKTAMRIVSLGSGIVLIGLAWKLGRELTVS